MPSLRSVSARLAALLALHGGWGLFGISFLDSSVLSFPLVNDLLLMHLASRFPAKAPLYAAACTAGSVVGASAIYGATRAGGSLWWRRRSPDSLRRTRQWLERNDFLALVVASLLPPPVPFKLFAISAGVLRVRFLRFVGALLVGRTLRFIAGALIGVRYGARAEAYLKANFGWVSATVVALLLIGVWAYRRFGGGNSKGD